MPEFVAGLGANHGGDLDRACRLVAAAAEAGFTAVKVPLWRVEEVFAPEILRVSPAHRLRRRLELPRRLLPGLADCAAEHGLRCGVSPSDLDSLEIAAAHADFLKVGSYELPWLDLVLRCAETGLPLQLSTGMADAGEVWNAVETALEAGCTDLTLLHTVSRYPTPPEACNLAAIGTLREMLVREFQPLFPDADLKAGWSDHTAHPGVIARAANHWGADVIELHLDLDGRGADWGGSHCWLPEHAMQITAGGYLPVNREADGSGRIVADPGEMEERGWRTDPADGLRPGSAVRGAWPDSQPEARREGPEVYIVADGGGFGRVTRCLALAESLRDDHDADVLFLVPDLPWPRSYLARHGFSCVVFDEPDDIAQQVGFLHGVTPDAPAPVCILDLEEPADDLVNDLAALEAVTVVIDQPEVAGADLVVVPRFSWREEGPALGGPAHVPVREDVVSLRKDPSPPLGPGARILVSFGNANPDRTARPVVRALHDILPHGDVRVVVPPGAPDTPVSGASLALKYPEFEFITEGDSLPPLLAAADLVVTGLGSTALEALCLGVPVLLLVDETADEEEVAALVATGAAADLGYSLATGGDELGDRLRMVLGDPGTLSRLRFHARELSAAPLDGGGAARVCDRIVNLARKRR